ncbi:DUF1735 domain-containing protein [Mucilaginibacter gotjawali]|uniref:BT-3987-like N-terminal domain-containing protein n=1 Tax=Mucilaginibacter gotjawali TaxID=1550579 RepID=A0A839SFX9_9SPHI|nr:DUF1735 domain-containing protein [Mucilaginibacter gotjawali]MBB3056706.1 hypothetical protein [Mucilaginibacter gotjawali]
MKKIIFILVLAAFSLSISSCLKDKPNTDFSGIGTVIELPWSGLQYFSRDAVTTAGDTVTMAFGINVASAKPLSTATNYTIAVDNSLLTAYNTANTAITYLEMPAGSYKITDLKGNAAKLSGTIPAGGRLDSVLVTVYKNQLDPSKSYMLPIKLVSASNGVVSGNFNAHYYHFIGNDFAGTYEHYYTRWETPDSTTSPSSNRVDHGQVIMSPVSPTELTVSTDYYTGPRYDITFTKTGSGPTATYSNWKVRFLPDDISSGPWATNITVVTSPMFVPKTLVFNSGVEYTYAQSLKLFRIYFQTASRAIIDEYVHQ